MAKRSAASPGTSNAGATAARTAELEAELEASLQLARRHAAHLRATFATVVDHLDRVPPSP